MHTMEEIEQQNLFEEAKERYEACESNRWKNKWWEILCTIWRKTRKFAKKYFLDIVNKIIWTIEERNNLKDIVEYTYWIRLYNDKKETVFSKIGTSNDPLYRWESILKENYCKKNNVIGYEVKRVWEIKNQWPTGLESYLRAMLIKKYGEFHVPNDRFTCEFTETEMDELANFYLT